ncbi:hypothetical protein GQR58_011697 [Nymphon striatum]|nr:hypothetical protein GQR58_011697 [Nymphon striatum]
MKKANALCLLSLKEIGRVPQTVVDVFVNSSTQIARNSIGALKDGLKNSLHSAGIDFSRVPGLKELFDESTLSMNPFSGIDKESLQYRYYKEHLNLVEPQRILLGRYHTKARRGHKLVNIQKSNEAFYIPLVESLEQLLNDDSILEEVQNCHRRTDDLMCDFCDGDIYKDHPLFGRDPYALQIIIYFDELEVCNPLGSRATKHKIGAFYYTLGNIDPKNRSHTNAIQLLGLMLNKNIKKYGVEPILEAFLSDLHLLERIIRLIFAPIINRDQIPYLQVLIEEYLERFKELYPQCSIIPKMHYMIHMPRTMLQLGPLVRSWCMRFEAKHHYFKRLAISIGNYTNLCFTLAKRHQEGLCYKLQSSEGGLSSFIEKGIETGKASKCFIGDSDYGDLIQDENDGFDRLTTVTEVNWITVLGTKYKLKSILHIGYDDNEFPKFWELKKICIVDRKIDRVMFVVLEKETVGFDKHYQCFEIATPVRGYDHLKKANN